MDMPDNPSGRSPKRELQGPRPTPLKVRKDSHKIKKPPVAPPPASQPYHHHHHVPPRPPVIIYTVSPKIIHANPNEFMALVQRLTGPNSTCTPSTSSPTTSSSSSAFAFPDHGGAISPAARFASIEKTKSPDGIRKTVQVLDQSIGIVEGIEIRPDIQRTTGQFPGILSPNPNTLPPIPPNFFSPPSENFNSLSFFHDLSPVLHSNRNNNYNLDILPSPSTFIISPQINMPSPNTLDLFHSLFDL
ncbi:UNVERIFIED_CONTAM: protein MKS1 [Sesamum latifolium]|uniref:Protein MKS1 n=1 Tax=Sesamum latifolium TaxID=2727402 RepID=A0AAW2W8M3_9LAMI